MHAVTLSDQMVEAAARALSDISDMGWQTASEYQRDAWREQARAALTAALALAEAEGAVLCVVPGEAHTVTTPDPPDWLAKTANNPHEAVVSWDLGHGAGHNDCRAATLAGRAWP